MKLQINWSENFLNPTDIIDLLRFIHNLKFRYTDIMEDWVDNPYAGMGKIKNTIALLLYLKILAIDEKDNISVLERQMGQSIAYLTANFEDIFIEKEKGVLFESIPFDRFSYSQETGQYGFFRNDSPLAYSGMLNLLISFGILSQSNGYYIEIKSDRLRKIIENQVEVALKSVGSITPEALKRLIERKHAIGEKSEEEAFKYEAARLKELNILKKPIRISLLDVTKGFDIMSYESKHSVDYDRFIEVKTFNTNTFYLSRNELMKARELGKNYFIYLVSTDIFTSNMAIEEVQNPAGEFEATERWGLEPNEYIVRRLI